ncbi:MAG: LysE family translocator [Gordonia sp. (in: high G+C Gram-positive bacteria)]|uniref:LysE family translocator n=1 Tax=Gordonia sp. (in: high G+C Gram-positive bacteria) TaxID=84139 RepID=UPI0039E645C9
MSTPLTLQFFAVALLFVMTPGADWAFAIAAGLRGGRIYPAITGMLAGYSLLVALIAVGVGALVTRYSMPLEILTLLGAAYLLWLGGKTLHAAIRAHGTTPEAAAGGGSFAQGFAVSSLNPKGLLLLLALLPQFVSPGAWAPPLQLLVLGSLFIAGCAVVYPTVSFTAQRLLTHRPRAGRIVTGVSGTVMLLLSCGLVIGAFTG